MTEFCNDFQQSFKLVAESLEHFIGRLRSVPVQSFSFRGRQFEVLRDDLIHPVISGNKLRKLWRFLCTCQERKKRLQTFGGPYSNHLVATAYAAKLLGIPCRAFVRGAYHMTSSLNICKSLGMNLISLNKEEFARRKNDFAEDENWITVPEGGKGPAGVASVKSSYGSQLSSYQVIWLAAGTLTTAIGVALAAPKAKVVAVPVLKAHGEALMEEYTKLFGIKQPENLVYFNSQHTGGYARWDERLLTFANDFYRQTGIMTDLVYTAKAFRAFFELENSPETVRNLLIHTGGLQGMLGILPQIKAKKFNLAYEAPLVAHLRRTHPGIVCSTSQ